MSRCAILAMRSQRALSQLLAAIFSAGLHRRDAPGGANLRPQEVRIRRRRAPRRLRACRRSRRQEARCPLARDGQRSVAVHRRVRDAENRGHQGARVVSMPSWDVFEQQDHAYKDSVLPPDVHARVAVEQAATLGWDRYVGRLGSQIVMHTFGASAPLKALKTKFGFTPERSSTRRKCRLRGRREISTSDIGDLSGSTEYNELTTVDFARTDLVGVCCERWAFRLAICRRPSGFRRTHVPTGSVLVGVRKRTHLRLQGFGCQTHASSTPKRKARRRDGARCIEWVRSRTA